MSRDSYISFEGDWLGEVVFTPTLFKKSAYQKLEDSSLKTMDSFTKHRFVGSIILHEIKEHKGEGFLLPAVLDFIDVIRKKVLPTYTFSSFEIYLENYAGLEEKESLFVRGKIVGKFIPRQEYQAY
ncbi:hypothetical protein K0U07_04505, partial [bacterium]|nr:hypothetical protein [bacterium]